MLAHSVSLLEPGRGVLCPESAHSSQRMTKEPSKDRGKGTGKGKGRPRKQGETLEDQDGVPV